MMGTPSNEKCAHLVLCLPLPFLGTTEGMRNNLKALRNARGWSQDELATRMGTTRNQITKLEKGSRRLSDVWIGRAAKAFEIDAGLLVSSADDTVPIVGDVGAGGLIAYHGEAQGDYDRAPKPPGATPETVAARVRGDSMPGYAEDQWLIYYDQRVQGVPDDWIGQMCVLWVSEDRVYVKKVFRGRDPGTFDLISTGGFEPMRDEEVLWSAKVTWIRPR